jgi:YebC/PmpR family DNA-binding regulatory protein
VVYEGYGPSGIAFLIETATDNRNRTTSEIKNIMTKAGGSLAGPNSVKWMFERKGVFRLQVEPGQNIDDFQLELIDLGADDVIEEQGGLTVYCQFESFPALKKGLEAKKITPEYAEIEWIAKDEVAVDQATQGKLDQLDQQLDDHDDVTNFYSTAKVPIT